MNLKWQWSWARDEKNEGPAPWPPCGGARRRSARLIDSRNGVQAVCPLPCALAVGLCGMLGACDDNGVHAYRAPKQHVHTHADEAPSVTWIAPQGWESVASDQQMRLATFRPGPGLPEVSLTAFPGDTGGLLANINRWRGQIGLGPIDEAQLAQTVQTDTVEGVKVTTVDITGASGQEMLGAIVVPGDGKTWFVKATGDPDAIARLKPAFSVFARTFRLQSSPSGAPPSAGPADDVLARLNSWTLPPNWRADPTASSIVAAAYEATNTDGGAKITATVLLNDGGGMLPNINRWRDQLGLPPVDKFELQPTTSLGGGSIVVDLAAADGSRRAVSAIVRSQNQTWFFKISGTPKGVEAEKAPFDFFVRRVGLGEQKP